MASIIRKVGKKWMKKQRNIQNSAPHYPTLRKEMSKFA